MTFCFYDDLHFNQKSFFIANRRPCCLQTVFPVQFQASVQLSVPVRAVRQRGMRAGDIHQKRRRASVVVVVDIVDIVVVVVGPPPLPPNHIEYPITSNLVAPKWTAPGRPCLSLSLSLFFFCLSRPVSSVCFFDWSRCCCCFCCSCCCCRCCWSDCFEGVFRISPNKSRCLLY